MASTSNNDFCGLCNLKFKDIGRLVYLGEKDKSVIEDFLVKHKVLSFTKKCIKCGKDCVRTDNGFFRCRKINYVAAKVAKSKPKECNFSVSVYQGTFFAHVRLPLWKIFQFVYLYLTMPGRRCVPLMEDLNIASHTYVDWANFMREVLVKWAIQNSSPIGGEGVVVEIDEAKFGRQKQNRGHNIKGQWVFGGVERNNKTKQFFVPVKDRSRETLVNCIKQHILPGSIIHSDCWSGHDNLGQEGYEHLTVNHSLNFVNPETGAHTQNIQRKWRDLRSDVPLYGRKKTNFVGYLAEARFKMTYKSNGERFHHFWIAVAAMYPPKI